METQKRPWSNPSKTKIWLFGMDSDMFCKKELELWDHIAGYGPNGCDNHNYKLQQEIHRSRTTIKRYLRNLKKHHLIVIIPGWAELSDGKLLSRIRDRRIIALPWPNKQTWMRESIRESLRKVGSKNGPLQRRHSKRHYDSAQRQQLDALLKGVGQRRPTYLPGGTSP